MESFRSLRHSILRFPERTRYSFAVVLVATAGIVIFVSWSALTASKFATISGSAFDVEGSEPNVVAENTGSVWSELVAGFRDLRAMLSGRLSTVPKASREPAEEPAPLFESPTDAFQSDWLGSEVIFGNATTSHNGSSRQ